MSAPEGLIKAVGGSGTLRIDDIGHFCRAVSQGRRAARRATTRSCSFSTITSESNVRESKNEKINCVKGRGTLLKAPDAPVAATLQRLLLVILLLRNAAHTS